jgi:mitochondrial inner membrane protease ATP23
MLDASAPPRREDVMTLNVFRYSKTELVQNDVSRCERLVDQVIVASIVPKFLIFLSFSLFLIGPLVRFLLDALEQAGCPFSRAQFACVPCMVPATGFFHPNNAIPLAQGVNSSSATDTKPLNSAIGTTSDIGSSRTEIKDPNSCMAPVALCGNFLTTEKQVEETMAHELIHAFDFCRRRFDYDGNAIQVACSEVRAANMSGDC